MCTLRPSSINCRTSESIAKPLVFAKGLCKFLLGSLISRKNAAPVTMLRFISSLLHLFSHFFKALHDEINILFRMARAYLCADPCLSLRHYRIGERYYINALLHHPFCELSRRLLIIEHNRHTWMGSRDDIKSAVYQLLDRKSVV